MVILYCACCEWAYDKSHLWKALPWLERYSQSLYCRPNSYRYISIPFILINASLIFFLIAMYVFKTCHQKVIARKHCFLVMIVLLPQSLTQPSILLNIKFVNTFVLQKNTLKIKTIDLLLLDYITDIHVCVYAFPKLM